MSDYDNKFDGFGAGKTFNYNKKNNIELSPK